MANGALVAATASPALTSNHRRLRQRFIQGWTQDGAFVGIINWRRPRPDFRGLGGRGVVDPNPGLDAGLEWGLKAETKGGTGRAPAGAGGAQMALILALPRPAGWGSVEWFERAKPYRSRPEMSWICLGSRGGGRPRAA